MLIEFFFKYVAVSSGITDQDSINLKKILTAVPQINYICLDVANGYTEHFVQYVRNTRAAYPDKTIIVNIFLLVNFIIKDKSKANLNYAKFYKSKIKFTFSFTYLRFLNIKN